MTSFSLADEFEVVQYMPLDYIESTSAARANPYTLPYTPVTATQIETKFRVYTASSGWCAIFCARNVYAGTGISLYKNGDGVHFGYFTGGTTGSGDNFADFAFDTDYTVTADVTQLTLNGVTKSTGNTVTNATTRQLSLFANPEWDNPMRGRLYYIKISEGGTQLFDFQPVVRNDGAFGFYDEASDKFVLPAQGDLTGYGYKTKDGQSYIYLSKKTMSLGVGENSQLTPVKINADEQVITWASSNPSVATVASDGTVSGVAAGNCIVKGTAGNGQIVFCKVTVLPATLGNYTLLDYIESTTAVRENVFTTPYIAKGNVQVDFKFRSTMVGGGNWRAIFSGRDGSDAGTGISLYQNGDGNHYGYFVGGYRNDNHADGLVADKDIIVSASLSNLKIDGVDHTTGRTEFNSSTRKISLFANPEWDNPYHGRIYYFRISEGDNQLYNFVPVMRHDGVYGYYDQATDTFVQPTISYDGYTFGEKAGESYIYMTETELNLTEGEIGKLTPVIRNYSDVTFTWSSDNPSVATVAADGMVSGVKEGTCTITGTSNKDGWTVSYGVSVVNTTRTLFTPLEYIENVSAVRENPFTTNYIPNANTQVDLRFYSTETGAWRAIFCGRSGSGNGMSLYQNGDGVHFGYFVGGYINDDFAPFTVKTEYTVTATLANLTINGTDYPTGRSEFTASDVKLSLFSNPGKDEPFRGRIYNFRISECGSILYDYQPVMRHDGEYGYYDATTGHFMKPVTNYDGYSFVLKDDRSYVYFTNEPRFVIVGNNVKYLPTEKNMSSPTYVWTSSDESVATVAADGTVTGVSAGTCRIEAVTTTDGGWSASYELVVKAASYTRTDANGVGYMVVDGGNGWDDSPIENVLDNDATTKFGNSNVGNGWFIVAASEPVALEQYSLVTGADTYSYSSRNPRSWKIEGSNNNTDWTEITSVVDDHKIPFANKEEVVYTVGDATTYRYFKFTMQKIVEGFQIGEFWINEQPHSWGAPEVTEATCATNGKRVYTCSECNAIKTEVIEATGSHSYSEGTCSVCGQSVKTVILLPDGQTNPYMVKYQHAYRNGDDSWPTAADGWNSLEFDDSSWDEMEFPIGSNGYDGGAHSGAKYNRTWYDDYNSYWIRRTFNLDEVTSDMTLSFRARHDDNYWVYLNGEQIEQQNDWNDSQWRDVVVDASKLRVGKNVLAVYIQQNWGGAYFDCSLTATYTDVNRTLTNGYATFSGVKDYAITTDGVKAYRAVESATPGYIRLEKVGTDIPANTGVVLFGEGKDNVTLEVTTGAAAVGSNMLHANVVDYALPAESDGCKNYTLGLDPENSSVCVFRPSSGEGLLAAGKAYLAVPNGGGAKYGITFGDETGINDELRENSDVSAPIFNLQGQRVNSSYKGVVVVGGKKFTVK